MSNKRLVEGKYGPVGFRTLQWLGAGGGRGEEGGHWGAQPTAPPLSRSRPSRLSTEFSLGQSLALTLTSSDLPWSILPSFSIQVPRANFRVSEQLFYDRDLFRTVILLTWEHIPLFAEQVPLGVWRFWPEDPHRWASWEARAWWLRIRTLEPASQPALTLSSKLSSFKTLD